MGKNKNGFNICKNVVVLRLRIQVIMEVSHPAYHDNRLVCRHNGTVATNILGYEF